MRKKTSDGFAFYQIIYKFAVVIIEEMKSNLVNTYWWRFLLLQRS